MKQVYAMGQQPGSPHIQTSATRTDPGNAPAQFTTSVNDMTVSLAKAKEDLTMAKSDLGGTMTELQGIQDYVTALHRECDYELTNFKTRQAALTQEMDAMREAEQILAATE